MKKFNEFINEGFYPKSKMPMKRGYPKLSSLEKFAKR